MSKEISDPKRLQFYSTNKSGMIQGGRVNLLIQQRPANYWAIFSLFVTNFEFYRTVDNP
jgi:hypothetical protein